MDSGSSQQGSGKSEDLPPTAEEFEDKEEEGKGKGSGGENDESKEDDDSDELAQGTFTYSVQVLFAGDFGCLL